MYIDLSELKPADKLVIYYYRLLLLLQVKQKQKTAC